jgi:two-component system, OmpR family, response regulator VicR
MKDILTTGEIAKHCNVHFRTVIRWIERGHLNSYKLPGRGDNRIRLDDFLDFLYHHGMPIPEALEAGKPKILIVDDDVPMAAAMQRILTIQGMQIEVAHNGFQAGVLATHFRPQVMSLDLQMVGVNGFQVLRFIREDKVLKKIKILVVSGLEKEKLDKALSEGADDILEKPFNNNSYIKKVEGLLV